MAEEMSRYNYPFINQYVSIPRHVMNMVDAENPKETEGVRHCLGLIVFNLLAQGEIAYSSRKNFYTGRHTRFYTYRNMQNALEMALARKYAVMSRPGYWNPKFKKGLSSTLKPGLRLSGIEPPAEFELDATLLPLLLVDGRAVFSLNDLKSVMRRISDDATWSDLAPRLPEAYHVAEILNRDYWNMVEIDRSGLSPGNRCFDRVGLTREFKDGGVGRWFQKGELSFQQLPSEERVSLRINGEAVAELDYPAMHPHILYAWAGQQCPGEFYERVVELSGCPRPIVKKLILMAVNAPNYRALSSAVNSTAREDAESSLYAQLKELGLSARDIVGAIVQAHPVLERYVFSGSANGLMLEESEIVTSVLIRLMELGIPALPVHDSVIAPICHGEAVRRVMEDTYRQHTGFSITVG